MGSERDKPSRYTTSPDVPTPAALSGGRLLAARAGWLVLFVVTVGLFSASIPAHYQWLIDFADPDLDPETVRNNLEAIGVTPSFYAAYHLSISIASAMIWVVVGTVIFRHRSNDAMAFFTSLCLIIFGTYVMNEGPIALAEQYPVAWLPVHVLAMVGTISFGMFFLVFPDGRFVPRWTRWVLALWAAHEAAYYLFPGSILNLDNVSSLLDFAVISTFLCVGVGSQLYRYWRVSHPVQRQQTKWVVFGMVAAGFGAIGFAFPFSISPTLAQFASPYAFVIEAGIAGFMLLIPLSIGVAILWHRLWDIDFIINRTLVYGTLYFSLIALYVLIVGTLGQLFHERGSLPISVLATGIVAIAFAPLRDRLQRGVNRLLYGERDDPYSVLSRLGQRLEAAIEPGAVLPTIVETVAGALKLPYVAIEMKGEDGFRLAASHGSPTGVQTALPLIHGGETMGRLILAPRAQGEGFSPGDRRLLEDLARNAEVAVQAVRLTADLRRSRERLLTTREEERRRLRRDLHDGLGPTLGGLTLGLDASLKLLKSDPRQAEIVMEQLKAQAKEAVSDVRRLVYGLRPPALDDLGLIGAIREHAAKHDRVADEPDAYESASMVGREGGLVFSIHAPAAMPPLSAAVEVACYRIIQEALNNVIRHARASFCSIRLSIGEGGIQLAVEDDGLGMPEDRQAGVGMSSMVERAEELGGRLTVAPLPWGGTRVAARLPLFEREGVPQG